MFPQLVAHHLWIDARLQLDLNRRDVVAHAAHILHFAHRHEDEGRIVLAHFAFIEIDDREQTVRGFRRRAGGGSRNGHIVARQQQKTVGSLRDRARWPAQCPSRARVLFLRGIEFFVSCRRFAGMDRRPTGIERIAGSWIRFTRISRVVGSCGAAFSVAGAAHAGRPAAAHRLLPFLLPPRHDAPPFPARFFHARSQRRFLANLMIAHVVSAIVQIETSFACGFRDAAKTCRNR